MKGFSFIFSMLFLISTNVYAFLLPASDKNLQPMATVEGVSGQGFIDPDVFTNPKSYTLDCQCLYDPSKKQWDGSAPNCLFINQCKVCKPSDKTCEIRYPDYGSSNIYKKTFYADNAKQVKVEYCRVTNTTKPICTKLSSGAENCKPDPAFKPNIVCELK